MDGFGHMPSINNLRMLADPRMRSGSEGRVWPRLDGWLWSGWRIWAWDDGWLWSGWRIRPRHDGRLRPRRRIRSRHDGRLWTRRRLWAWDDGRVWSGRPRNEHSGPDQCPAQQDRRNSKGVP